MIEDMYFYDSHAHEEGLLSSVAGFENCPRDIPIADFRHHGIDLTVLCAVGDPRSFGLEENSLSFVEMHIERIKQFATAGDAVLVTSFRELEDARENERTAYFLGIEGCDFVGADLGMLDHLYNLGVRFLGPVHFSENQFGSIGMGLSGEVPADNGLTALGKEFVTTAQDHGMIIDLSHASDGMIVDTCKITRIPSFCSHSGLRSYFHSPRFIGQEAAQALKDTGGLLGLWNCRFGSIGPETIDDSAEMILAAADEFGSDRIAIGSDTNAAPGYPAGYGGIVDMKNLVHVLKQKGYPTRELAGFLGGNLLEFLKRAGI